MAADISVITEVAQQASSFDFTNQPDSANLDTWKFFKLIEFPLPQGACLTGRKYKLLAL